MKRFCMLFAFPTAWLYVFSGPATASPAASCDGAWYEIPGGGVAASQPVGIYIPADKNTQYTDSVGVVYQGMDNHVYYQVYSLSAQDWSGQWSDLGGQTRLAPFTYVGDAWDVMIKDVDPPSEDIWHNINWSTGWTGWTNQGPGEGGWGRPVMTVDDNRLWKFQRDSQGHVSYACRPLTAHTLPQPVPRLLLAFYYNWYGTLDGPSGEWRHWDPAGPDHAVTDDPALGYYDSHDPGVLRRHLRWAKRAGIDGFIVTWWGRNTFEDLAFAELMSVAEELEFSVTVYVEQAGGLAQARTFIQYILDSYASSPAFLKIEGLPVIFLYQRVASSIDWDTVRELLSQGGRDVFLVGDGFSDTNTWVFDGIHSYAPIRMQPDEVGQLYLQAASAAGGRGCLFAATVLPGYDDTVIRDPGFQEPRRGGDYYREMWQASLAAQPHWVLITSFNEWHEGSEIEPSIQYGEQYLDLTAELARVFKGDVLAPMVSIVSPAPDSTVGDTVSIQVDASDDTAITLVEFFTDNLDEAFLLGVDASHPYSLDWDSSLVANGPHTLIARAYDTAGNHASATTTVTVYNDTTPPAAPGGLRTIEDP